MSFASLFKRLLPLAGLIFAAGPAFAIQDTNTNGLSDVWERHYNNGNLFSGANPSHALTADPDGDGWDNAKEAIAGTDPFSTALPAGWVKSDIAKHPDAEGLFILTWPSIQGKVYKLALSPDLVTWTDFGELMPGTGQNISLAVDAIHQDGTIPERLFWRVKIEDDDPDGDTLTTWEELALGYDPYSADTDLDGIPDNLDATPLSNNAVADPDGAGLVGTTLSTNMIGQWDFESYDTITNPPAGHTPWRFPDRASGGRHATSFSVFTHDLGMPSKATNHAGGFVTIPPSLLNNRNVWSVAFWANLDEGSVESSDGRPMGLFAHHRHVPHIPASGVPNWGYYTATANGVWIQKDGSGNEVLRAGTYAYANHNNGVPLNPPTLTVTGVAVTMPYGTFDDGKWHHYVMVKNNAFTTLYVDGVLKGTVSHNSPALATNAYNGVSLGRLHGVAPETGAFQPPNQSVAKGRFDRLRVWSRAVSSGDATNLHREDIDRDGLWDITEVKTRLWRDANSDAVATPSEFSYVSSPFEWQPADWDTDGDGASDLVEQAAGPDIGKADTDGDLIPDGWELLYPGILDPLDPSDASLDPDGDGLTNLQEWQYNTNPTNPNSDGEDPDNPDTVNDGDEVAGGSDPNDPTDGGQAPPAGQKVSILLGVGDESGSESEDYILNCYRIDRETGEEERIYTVRSGGFGQYKEETKDIFRKGESYSFQIQWQGSNLASRPANPGLGISAEGPDFDYTFKVQSQGDHGGMLIDSWNPSNGTLDPTRHLLDDDANDVAADAPEFKRNYSDRRVVLYSVLTHSVDRMFAGSLAILPGFEQMELTITSPDSGRDFGTHGYLMGGGDTRVYESLKGMLGYEDRWGTLVTDPSVWFLRDPLAFNRVEFYLVSGAPGDAYGKIKVEAKVQGQSLGSIERTLQPDAQFAETIDLVTGWAAGRGFGFDTGGGVTAMNNHADGAGLADPHLWSTPTLIPFMLIGHQVEGVTIVARGLVEGVVAGFKDDLEFVGLILSGAVIVSDWSTQALLNEIEKWQNDPRARISELHAIVTDLFDKQVFLPLASVALDMGTFEGVKKRFWHAVLTGVTVSTAINADIWHSTVNALEDWFDDFGNRMADGAERTAWLDTPLNKTGLFAEGTQLMREQCYTFGYTLGYLCEQVAIGALTGGTVKIAQVAAKGGISLAANVAKRTAGAVAIRGHWMKKIMADSGLGDAIIRAMYERGMLAAAVEPTGPTIKKCAFDILESLFSRSGFNRATYNFKKLLDDVVPDGNIRKLIAQEGSEALIHKRAAQIAYLLGDECDETVMKNFLKVAEERLIVTRPDGSVDEFFESFFRCFEGNPSLMVNADTAELSLSQMSANAKAYLKNFLSDPNGGYLWKIDDPQWVDGDVAIPHNYWVRGLMAELDIYKRVYKPLGYTHSPTAAGVDFTGPAWVQIKSTSNPAGAFEAMKKAINALIAATPSDKTMKLHILKKPGTDSSALESSLNNYVSTQIPVEDSGRLQMIFQSYNIGPQ